MAERGALTGMQQGREASTLHREASMSKHVDTGVEPVQSLLANPPVNSRLTQPGALQLWAADCAPLLRRQAHHLNRRGFHPRGG